MRWNFWLLFTHVASDAWIALAYFSIPIALIVFVRRRKDIQFGLIFWLFSLFIFCCGLTHVAAIVTLWYPDYWVEGWIKAAAAVVSVITAIVLWPIIPKALKIPSSYQLSEANEKLRNANEALQNATEAKNRFLASMSHELRTPLNGIIGFTEFLVDEKPGDLNPKQKEYLGDILSSGRHLLQLINDILDLAKVESGKMELHPETFRLDQAVTEVCTIAEPIARKKGIRVTTTISPQLSEVTLDQHKLKQVLFNLLSNAIKFTDDGGHVEISVTPHESNRFKLAVMDSGIGIKPGNLKRLFTDFEQIDSSGSQSGTGLGLSLTRRIVDLQGGSIDVESKIGKGSTFTVILPLTMKGAKS